MFVGIVLIAGLARFDEPTGACDSRLQLCLQESVERVAFGQAIKTEPRDATL